MTFYHRTLVHPSGVNHAVIGNFVEEEREDIIVSTGRFLKVVRFQLDSTGTNMITLLFVDTYDTITSLSKFRWKDETKDWIVIATVSGSTAFLAVNAETMQFRKVVIEKFKVQIPKTFPAQSLAVDFQGYASSTESNLQDNIKDEISRVLPIQHMAVDSKGRAVFIAALEEMKRFWFVHGSGDIRLKIVDHHEEKTLIYDIAFVDTNSENIIVAYLAIVYEEFHAGLKYKIKRRRKPCLVFSEVNEDTVTEIKRIECLDYANSLISVPGQRGVLVCAEDFIAFYPLDSSDIIRCSIPKRIMDPKAGVIFVCSTNYDGENPNLKHVESSLMSSIHNSIYYLAQTEQGDTFRIQLVVNELGVNEIVLKYFITLPVASALCILKSGLLFVGSEFGCQCVYKMADIESHARVHPSFSSASNLMRNKPFLFMHRTLNIPTAAEIECISPIMQMELETSSSKSPQMCLAVGRASSSTMRINKFERDVTYCHAKLDEESDLIPMRMWAIESTESICKELKTLIVVSFEESTAVYSLEKTPEYAIKKLEGTPFAYNIGTLGCAKIRKDAIVQICPGGACLIKGSKNLLFYDSRRENNVDIVECAINERSVVVAVEKKLLWHFEFDTDGSVTNKVLKRLINGFVSCMLLLDKNESEQLLAVGVSLANVLNSEATVNVVNLLIIGPSEIKFLCQLEIENTPYSFIFLNGESNLQLFVGCENGTLLTLAVVETVETEGRTKHELRKTEVNEIGSEAVQLLLVPVMGNEQANKGILAISNYAWLKETADGEIFRLKSDIFPCACVMHDLHSIGTIWEDQIRIFTLESSESKASVPISLAYTPRKFTIDSNTGNIFIIESDDNSYTVETKEKKRIEFEEHMKGKKPKPALKLVDTSENIPKSWASQLRVVNMTTNKAFTVPFDQNEVALSLCHLKRGSDDILLAGVAKNFKNCSQRRFSQKPKEPSINIYKIFEEGNAIRFLHKTDVKSLPSAMCCYKGYVLVGIGRKLALYDVLPESLELQLVCERKDCVSNSITAIYPVDERILVSDSEFGISYVVYISSDGKSSLHLLQENVFPIEVTAACVLKNNRMVRATKSRDIFIVELATLQDRDMSLVCDDEPPYTLSKEKMLGSFHVGEVVTSFQIFSLQIFSMQKSFPQEPDTVLYTTLSGSIGILSVMLQQKDAEFLNNIYEALHRVAKEIDEKRTALPIFTNCWLRSRHFKRMNVVDGDFLDEYDSLEPEFLQKVLEEIKDYNSDQMSTKLQELKRDMLDFQFWV